MNRIFLQIASYRDPELVATVTDAFNKAAHPEALSVGICHQGTIEEWEQDVCAFKHYPNVRVQRWLNTEADGCCWARALTQRLWQGEDFTYQIDSHSRFAQNWDDTLVEMLHQCKSDRPILSSYPASYDPETGELQPDAQPFTLGAKGFNQWGVLDIVAPDAIASDQPVPGCLIAAGSLFTVGRWNIDCPYDPHLFFNGEESSLAIRSYTHGYDIFYPHKQVLYHNYSRHQAIRPWTEKSTYQREIDSYARYRQLLGMEPRSQDFGKYDLGTARSLADYEAMSGINFPERTIAPQSFSTIEES